MDFPNEKLSYAQSVSLICHCNELNPWDKDGKGGWVYKCAECSRIYTVEATQEFAVIPT